MTDINAQSCRAARALLGWSMADLAQHAAIALQTIQRIESGKPFYESTGLKLIETFRAHGVEVLLPPAYGARVIPHS